MNKKLTSYFEKKYKITKEADSYLFNLIEYLRRKRPTIYTVLRHVSASGMFRRIDVYIFKNDKPVYLTGLCERLGIGKRATKDGARGIGVSGCGMDMGFSVVYSLGSRLFPDGFKLHKGEHGRNGNKSRMDKDGGYALKQEWL